MSLQLFVILGLSLATLLCAVVTVYLYRRSPKAWYWYASANLGAAIAPLLYQPLLGFFGISLQFSLILSLVLGGLLFAVAALLYRRSGVSTKAWYAYIGALVALLLFFTLLDFFVPGSWGLGMSPWPALFAGSISIIGVLWRRSRTR
jgi:hypothetical protein